MLTPLAIQVIHVFENHEHSVCVSINDPHFHDNDNLDCEQLHYLQKVFSTKVCNDYEPIAQQFYIDKSHEQPSILKVVHSSNQSSRAPPKV